MQSDKLGRVMVVDDNITNLNIARKALENLYDVMLIPSGEKALSILNRILPDLILLDIEMPGMDGFEVINHIKAMPAPVCDIPVIFLTAKTGNESEYEGLNLGAIDYITKPFSIPLLLKRVELHIKLARQQSELLNYSNNLKDMVLDKTKDIIELQYSVVYIMSDMVERRDGSTGGHLLRTRNFIKLLLDEVIKKDVFKNQLRWSDFEMVAHASQMHDVGKISIPDSILLKPGRLTPDEFEIMKQHAPLGEDAIKYALSSIKEATFLEMAAEFASSHHERWDGTGYPRGLEGEDIPLTGRMMAIVDVYDALISVRPYKDAMPHSEAVKIIKEGSGSHFDPRLVEIFVEIEQTFETIALENALH